MAGKWTKGNWPKGEPKLAAIVEEAVMQLVEVQRFAWGYYTGHVTAAGANTLTDADAKWLWGVGTAGRWGVKDVGTYWRVYNVAVRHCIDPVNHIYVWEWQPIYNHTANTLTLFTNWKRVPAVGSPYLITRETPWVAWMWDELLPAAGVTDERPAPCVASEENGVLVDRTLEFTSSDTEDNVVFMEEDGDYLYIGCPETFNEVGVSLQRGASEDLKLDLEYSYNDSGGWSGLNLDMVDGTGGFQHSGEIRFNLPGAWVKTALAAPGVPLPGPALYYVRIKRQESVVETPPIESKFGLGKWSPDMIQLAKQCRSSTKQSFYHSIVENPGFGVTGPGWLPQIREGSFGLFGGRQKAHFYGGNTDKVFETEVAGVPAAKGEYHVDYALCRVMIYENSQRPSGVKARYACGLWPPGYHGQGDELTEHTFNGIEDFYGALWHFSVKGDTDSEGDWAPGLPKLGSASGNPSGLLNPVDTFTELRRGIQGLCTAGMIWDPLTYSKFTFAGLYNRAMGAGITWAGDLSRGVGRDIPEGSLLNYGRTWVVCIGEILKCLEQMRWIVIKPLDVTPSVYDAETVFCRVGDDWGPDFATVKAATYAEYLADAWGAGSGIGVSGRTYEDMGIYYCSESMYGSPADYPGRYVVAFDTQDRKDFEIQETAGYGGPIVWLLQWWCPDEFESFNIQVYLAAWSYDNPLTESSGDTLAMFRIDGIVTDHIEMNGPPGVTVNISCVPINAGIWHTDAPIVFRFQSTNESENLIPDPVVGTVVSRAKAVIDTVLMEAILAVQPIFTFTFGTLP